MHTLRTWFELYLLWQEVSLRRKWVKKSSCLWRSHYNVFLSKLFFCVFFFCLIHHQDKNKFTTSNSDHSSELWGEPFIGPEGLWDYVVNAECFAESFWLSSRRHVRKTVLLWGRKQGGLTVCVCERVIFTSQACCIVTLNSAPLGGKATKRVVQTHWHFC